MDRRRARGRTDLNASHSTAREGETFDRLVAAAGDFNPFEDRGWDSVARRFSATVGGTALRVLDVGCGTGRSRVVYRRHAQSYVGIDLSYGALLCARRREVARWIRSDGLALPFRDGSFDVVSFSSVLHHLEEPAAALEEARRVLVSGGHVFAFDPNVFHPAMALFRHPSSPAYRPEGVSPGERPLRPAILRRMFADAGLTRIGQRCQSGIAYRRAAVGGLAPWLGVFHVLDRTWEAVGLGRWFGTFVFTWGVRGS